MKKFTFILILSLIFSITAMSQSELLVGWTFPTNNSLAADTGLNLIPENEIITLGGTSDIELKNGYTTKAPQVTGWDSGMETKAWLVKVKSTGYNNITVSSRQQSGGNDPGPAAYKIQYSLDNGNSWSEAIGEEIVVENDWTTSYIDKLALPNACENLDEFWIRWVMASDIASGNGGTVIPEGKSKIDNIFIHGDKINGLVDHRKASFELFPNPATEFVNISSFNIMTNIKIADISGKTVFQKVLNTQLEKVDLSNLPKGLYFISIQNKEDQNISNQKLLIQ